MQSSSLVKPTIRKELDTSKLFQGQGKDTPWLVPHGAKGESVVEKFWSDDEGLRYITYRDTANKLVDELTSRFGSSFELIDATAGIGGDTIAFAQKGAGSIKVTAFERDANRFYCLQRNVELCGVNDRIQLLNEDFLDYLEAFRSFDKPSDVPRLLLIDPPWGGDNYKEAGPITDLYLYRAWGGFVSASLISIIKLVAEKGTFKAVVLKLPTNFVLMKLRKLGKKVEVLDLHKNILYVLIHF